MKRDTQDSRAQLHISRLSYAHPDGSEALDITALTIPLNQTIVLCGRNGAGKSLFAHALAGLLPQALLQIEFRNRHGEGSAALNLSELKKKSGIIFQNSEHQVVGQTVEEDIAFGLRNLQYSREDIVTHTKNIMETCELTPFAKRHPLSLSGGELKRVAIAAMMVLEPQLLILDEPFLNLDWHGQQTLLALLRKLRQNNTTLLIVTHNLHGAHQYAEWMVVMHQGRIVAHGTPKAVIEHAIEKRIAAPDAASLAWR